MVGAWIGFAAGLMLVMGTLMSVAGTLVVPRAVNSPASRMVEWLLDIVFRILTKPVRSFGRRDKILSWQAPMSLLTRLAAWLGMLVVGFALAVVAQHERPSRASIFRGRILDIHPRLRGAVDR